MTEKQVWLITGAGRGMGIDIARAALAAGHAVVGTARNADSVTAALGAHDDLLADALVQLVAMDEPPLRFAAGADAVGLFESKAQTLLDQANAHRELSSNLGHYDA